ncbi:MAG: alpha/beta hydrolase [Myxococcales bacterium]|nr:alpha/beta hydrolase [Myxococcales bacterium]
MRWMAITLGLVGCVNIDGFIHNGVPCSEVSEQTCTDEQWDSVCLTCDEPYDWARTYEWFDTMLQQGESVRAISSDSVVREMVPTTDGLGQLDTYFVPAHGDDAALASTTLFYNHGNFAGIEHYLPRLQVLHELGYNIFVWDYRGYDKSEPAAHPTAEQFLADARQMRDHVATVAPDAERILPYGYSLGAIPAVEASVHAPGCALFLEAPFTSTSTIAQDATTASLPESYLSGGQLDNVSKIEGYPGALLTMVGSDDGRFGPELAKELTDAAPGPTDLWVLEGVEHGISNGGVVEAGMAAYRDRMRSFLEANAAGCLSATR